MIPTTHSFIVDSVHGHRNFSLEEGTESWYNIDNGPLALWRELIVGNCLGDMAHALSKFRSAVNTDRIGQAGGSPELFSPSRVRYTTTL